MSHTKSRNGCYACKHRRVKCDEERPVCGACLTRGNDCVFPNPVIARDLTRRRPTSHAKAPDSRGVQIRPLDLNFIPNETANPHGLKGGLNMHDLKLLQHYILHTSKRMTLHHEKAVVWERVIPGIASEQEYLMHLLLALAGLDVLTTTRSSTSSQKKHDNFMIQIVMEHHQEGLKGLQQDLDTISASKLEDVLTGSMLINAFAFASLRVGELNLSMEDPQHYPAASGTPQSVPYKLGRPQTQWLYLVRGICSIVGQSWIQLQRSRLRSLLVFKKANEDWKHFKSDLNTLIELPSDLQSARLSAFVSNASQAIFDLRAFSNALKTSIAPSIDNSGSESFQSPGSDSSASNSTYCLLRELDQAIEVVEMMYMRILHVLCLRRTGAESSSDSEIQAEIEDAAIASWPNLVGPRFISSLNSDRILGSAQGLSLTILAHLYLTLVLLDKIWYFDGVFDLEIKKIAALITQSADFQLIELMKWPVHVIEQ
ncbi:hypothetical protein MYU51_019561 [Penicillium brevicompactum]